MELQCVCATHWDIWNTHLHSSNV